MSINCEDLTRSNGWVRGMFIILIIESSATKYTRQPKNWKVGITFWKNSLEQHGE